MNRYGCFLHALPIRWTTLKTKVPKVTGRSTTSLNYSTCTRCNSCRSPYKAADTLRLRYGTYGNWTRIQLLNSQHLPSSIPSTGASTKSFCTLPPCAPFRNYSIELHELPSSRSDSGNSDMWGVRPHPCRDPSATIQASPQRRSCWWRAL